MRRNAYSLSRYQGSALTELLIAAALSMAMVLSAITVIQVANQAYFWHQENAVIEEHANYVTELITRAVRQAAYRDYVQPMTNYDELDFGAYIKGADNRSLKPGSQGWTELNPHAIHGSDVLAVHFAGASDSQDASRINCAGFRVARAASASEDEGWSIFYVAENAYGESELRCKYRGAQEWQSQALIEGVEGFQVLYGVDTDGDGWSNCYVNATAIDDHDRAAGLNGSPVVAWWSKIVSVQIALLLRASGKFNSQHQQKDLHLFGERYSAKYSERDPGTYIVWNDFAPDLQWRLRRIVQTGIYLRNSLADS